MNGDERVGGFLSGDRAPSSGRMGRGTSLADALQPGGSLVHPFQPSRHGRFQFPLFSEEISGGDAARGAGVGGLVEVNHGPIGQLRGLAGVVEVIVFPEGEAAVEHEVTLRVHRVRVDADQGVVGGGEGFFTGFDFAAGPGNGKLPGGFGDEGIGGGIAPEDEVRGFDIVFRDGGVVLHPGLAAEVPPPMLNRAIQFRLGPGSGFFAGGFSSGADEDE